MGEWMVDLRVNNLGIRRAMCRQYPMQTNVFPVIIRLDQRFLTVEK